MQALNGGEQTWAASLPLFVSYFLLPILLRRRRAALPALRHRRDHQPRRRAGGGTAFAAVGYTALVVALGRPVERADRAASGCRCWRTAVVALAFQPLRRRVVRLANRLAYGRRAQPYEALADFSRRLAETPHPDALLPAVAEAAGRAVVGAGGDRRRSRCPVAERSTARPGADRGRAAATDHVVPVRIDGRRPRRDRGRAAPGRRSRPADLRLLEALADQAALAFRNTVLGSQLAAHVAALDAHDPRAGRVPGADHRGRRRRAPRLEAAIAREVLPHLTSRSRSAGCGRSPPAAPTPSSTASWSATPTPRWSRCASSPAASSPPSSPGPGWGRRCARCWRRSGLAAPLTVDASAAGRRFAPRVEAAVYFCCVEAARGSGRGRRVG